MNLWTSVVRTLTPRIAAWLIVILARVKIDIDSDMALIITAEVIGGVYYVGVRLLERFRGSKWGRLLGVASQPSYAPTAK